MMTKGPVAVTRMIKDCIRQEMNPEGLLSDVESFVPAYRSEEEWEEPLIWVYEHETIGVEGSGTLFNKQLLQTPFEFFCVAYSEDDLEQSEILGKCLATRVAAAIKHNIKHTDDEGSYQLKRLLFSSLNTPGTVDIVGKSERAVVTSVKVTLEYFVDWNYVLSRKKICNSFDIEVSITKE